MAIGVISTNYTKSATTGLVTTLSLTLPALQAGQMYLVCVGWRNTSSDSSEISPPTGWTEIYENIGSIASSQYLHAAVFRRTTTASSFAITLTAAGAIIAAYAVIGEIDTALPIIATGTAYNSASTNSVTASAANHAGEMGLDVVWLVTDADSNTGTDSDYTRQVNQNLYVSSASVDVRACLHTAISPATTAKAFTVTSTGSYPVIARMIALREYVAPLGPSFSRDGVPGVNIASVDAVPGTNIAAVDGVTAQLQEWRKAA